MYARFIEQRVRQSMHAKIIVLMCGLRQSGKTTLARQIANDEIPYISLDYPSILQSVTDVPH